MQITDLTSGEAEVVTDAGDIVTELSRADTHSSVEALCRVWRQSRSDDLPHICSSLHNIVIHLNGEHLAAPGPHLMCRQQTTSVINCQSRYSR